MSDLPDYPLSELIGLDTYVEQLCQNEPAFGWGAVFSPGSHTRQLYDSGALPVVALSEKPFRDPSGPRSLGAWRIAKSKPRRNALDEIAEDLERTPRQVRRYLKQLIRAGKAPASWFDGYQYDLPDSREAAALIRQEFLSCARCRRPKAENPNPWDAWVLELHAQRKRCEAKLHERREIIQWLERFARAHAVQWATGKISRPDDVGIAKIARRFRSESVGLAFGVITTSLYGMEGLKLKIGFYDARVCGSPSPDEHVCQLLNISSSTFWRKYGHSRKLMKEARDGGDGYFNLFALGLSPRDVLNLKPAPSSRDEGSGEDGAWD